MIEPTTPQPTMDAANKLRILENMEAVMNTVFRLWRGCLASCMTCTTTVEEKFNETIEQQKCLAMQEQRNYQAAPTVRAPGITFVRKPPATSKVCEVHGPY
eukprot:Blabericola_migrator_1__9359@NODE_5044_length_893_cov_230_684019_g3184_i0_p2_GENE_NODE_5044_length_893_cov_230_684019_g3184_i0NODE_5044_length_893_cov_230_684019_g3184_i0_p2_ORF_typecomplete_len101_score17_42_NODE_5044_length_893_cov_230_684019_g3184_i0516818